MADFSMLPPDMMSLADGAGSAAFDVMTGGGSFDELFGEVTSSINSNGACEIYRDSSTSFFFLLIRSAQSATSDSRTGVSDEANDFARSSSRTGIVICGVLIAEDAVMMISLNLGIPNVTLPAPCPAKWKVLSVICVTGSPRDWDAMQPDKVKSES